MKKAVIALYIIVAIQSCVIVLAFIINHMIVKQAFYEAGKGIGENLIKICEERYVQK